MTILCIRVCCMQFNDEFVSRHYPSFESAADLKQSLITTTSLARMKDLEAQTQDAIVTQVLITIISVILSMHCPYHFPL